MKLELDTLTLFTIKDALNYCRKINTQDKESIELAYETFLDAWFESTREEMCGKSILDEIIKSHKIENKNC